MCSATNADSAYTAEQAPPPVRNRQSTGMAEGFVKIIKRDYVAHMPA